MRIGIVGGTGKQGTGLAIRWSRTGHTILLGSRDAAKARRSAAELASSGHSVEGGDNAWAAREAELAVLTVPYDAHGATIRAIAGELKGKVLVDVTVPLKPPKVSRVQLPPGQAAALEAQELLGPSTHVAAALHHVSSTHLADTSHVIACDVLVAADDASAKAQVMGIVRDLGLRALDAGPLANAVALESLTPVLIHLNRVYKSQGAGIVFTDLRLPQPPPT
jgi:8-hydroxy-5-deazaflavin:NADPH oxidoreductase